jgi:membrane-bound lytic murein transglycosylase D
VSSKIIYKSSVSVYVLLCFSFISCSFNKGDTFVHSNVNFHENKEFIELPQEIDVIDAWGSRFSESEAFYKEAILAASFNEWARADENLNFAFLSLSSWRFSLDSRDSIAYKKSFNNLLDLRGFVSKSILKVYSKYSGNGLAEFWVEDSLLLDSTSQGEMRDLLSKMDLSDFELPIQLNERVFRELVLLSRRIPKFTSGSLTRLKQYESMIAKTLRDAGLPRELMYLALVESGFKSSAYSTAKASGVWQFIPSTGRAYGLDIDWWIDERRNPEKATAAAATYLKRLYGRFGDWYIAMASYNCGQGCVSRSIRRAGHSNYWGLGLPTETAHYVPRIIAAAIIAKNPELFGLKIKEYKPVILDSIEVSGCYPFDRLADKKELTKKELELANPELWHGSTPPDREFWLKFPTKNKMFLKKRIMQLKVGLDVCVQKHRVKRGDNLYTIARHYGVSLESLKQANRLSRRSIIRPGQMLIIPAGGKIVKSKGSSSKRNKKSNQQILWHKVKSGETLISISQRYKTDVKTLMTDNKLKKPRIFVGQKLRVNTSRVSSSLVNAPKNGKAKAYTVKSGDNVSLIAEKLSVPTSYLLSWNKLYEKSVLLIGQKLVYFSVTEKGSISSKLKSKPTTKAGYKYYMVTSGDNLGYIAQLLGVTISGLKKWNNLKTNNLALGQELAYKTLGKKVSTTKSNSKKVYYIVQRGDNLYSIAKKLGVTIDELKKWNVLKSSALRLKQRLLYYKSIKPSSRRTHKVTTSTERSRVKYYVVRRGDNLWSISKRYKVSVDDLKRWNGPQIKILKPGDRIKVGGK